MAMLQKLKHKHIVKYIDNVQTSNQMYIFMEYMCGGSLLQTLKQMGAFKESVIQIFVRQLLLGLEYLHMNQVIHRDIKSPNILLDKNSVVKLSDFGTSNYVREDEVYSFQGSILWMSM